MNRLNPAGIEETEKNLAQMEKLFSGDQTLSKSETAYRTMKWQLRIVNLLKSSGKKKPSLEEVEVLLEEYPSLDAAKHELKEKDVLEKLSSSCREWLDHYHGLLKKSSENLEKLNSSLEKGKNKMNIEDHSGSEKSVTEAIDEVIRRYHEYQTHKIKASDFDALITKADKFPVQFINEIKFMTEEKDRTEKFRKSINFDQKHLTYDRLMAYISENDSYILNVPEMTELYKLLQLYKHFEVKFLDILTRLKGNSLYYSITDGPRGDKYKKVTLDDITKLLRDAQQIPLNLDSMMAPITECLFRIKSFRNNFGDRVKACHSIQDLTNLKSEGLKIGVSLPEIDDLKRRVSLY